MKYRILSYYINEDTPLYGDTQKPKITPDRRISHGDTANTFFVTVHSHTGTHIEAPKHFIEEGQCVSDYPLDKLVFKSPLLVSCPKEVGEHVELSDITSQKLDGVDCLIFQTGFGRFRDSKPEVYSKQNPGISPEVVGLIREKAQSIRCIGIDSVSISSFSDRPRGRKAHRAAFTEEEGWGEPLLLVEDMNLSTLSENDKLKRIYVIPWQVLGVDSLPCRVVAEVE